MFVDVLQIICLYPGYQSVINTVFLLEWPLFCFFSSLQEYQLKGMNSQYWLLIFKNRRLSSMFKYSSVEHAC